ncbi:hypothetical protein P3T37_003012 [Kitasatospora sp. MAA4]|uniref:DUF3052 domain-containing protein n=1 Tax=Kitasatospora sp. MAA4 TaxID=3035093 RepID=UPI002472EAD9|nr:DUF3052 domain-containing protein [Kitasatospora sp. MAA4]MDH6133616.1 hypothetical protein [Kitasatospora sp. MAA4]
MNQTGGYSGTPLLRKLGVKAGHRVLFVRSPDGFDPRPMPAGVRVHRRAGAGPYDVIVAFAADRAVLDGHLAALPGRLDRAGALWICWPKKSSGVRTDVGEQDVRAGGLALPVGLVDVKVAAIDATWSALKFVYRLGVR